MQNIMAPKKDILRFSISMARKKLFRDLSGGIIIYIDDFYYAPAQPAS